MTTRRMVFIRGTGRCGSKTLIRELARHPDIARLPFNEILPEELIDWTESRLGSQRAMTLDVQAAACRAYLSVMCQRLCPDGRMIVQKSTMNAHRLGDLLRYWPDCKIVYLVRHPLAVVESMINSNIREDESFKANVANCTLRWFNEVSAYLQSQAFGDARVREVHFEDLVEKPQETVNRICRFLDVPDLDVTRIAGREQYRSRFVLTPRERKWIIECTRSLAGALGYEDGDMSAASDVSPGEATDFAERRLKGVPPALDGRRLIGLALERAAEQGFRRVGLFGAGYLARLLCPRLDLKALMLQPVGLFDENPMLLGSRVGPLKVYHPRHVHELGVDAVIPLTFVRQGELIRRWKAVYGGLARIIPLWEDVHTPKG